MFLSAPIRFLAIFLSLVTAFSVITVDTAEARRGGSFGSRGVKTFQSVPATKTSPNVTAPVQNTRATPAPATSAARAQAPQNTGLFSGGLMRGLFLGGLFGLFLGTGFGGMGGMLSLLFQLALIGGLVWFFFGRRRLATAGGPGMTAGLGSAQPRPAPAAPATRPLEVSNADLDVFEDRLKAVQDAFSRGDEAGLARLTTPEMLGFLRDELADNASRGVRNEVLDVRMLGGSVAEAWSEGRRDFATVSIRYESRDILRDVASGEIVSGSDGLSEAVEIWTFSRENGGEWQLSAIQDA